MPRWSAIWRETQGTISQFFSNAIPIFLVITIVASVLDWFGLITGWINPLMGLFGLPPEAALPVILASIRKDGLLLFAQHDTKRGTNTSANLDECVPQAGRLLPCLVTALTIAREQSVRFAVGLMARSRDRGDRFFHASGLGRQLVVTDVYSLPNHAIIMGILSFSFFCANVITICCPDFS